MELKANRLLQRNKHLGRKDTQNPVLIILQPKDAILAVLEIKNMWPLYEGCLNRDTVA